MYTPRESSNQLPIEQVINIHIIVKRVLFCNTNALSLFFFFSGLDFYGYIKLINFVRLKVGVSHTTSVSWLWRIGSQSAVLSVCPLLIIA